MIRTPRFGFVALIASTATLAQTPATLDDARPYAVPSLRDMMILTPSGDPKNAAPRTPAPEAPKPETRTPEPPADPSVDVAYGAYQRGLYVAAFAEAKKRAEGMPLNPAAMTLLGELYARGQGVRRDPAEAARWYDRASELGDREAMLALGLAHLEGEGVAKNAREAAALFQRAGDLRQAEALYNLGLLRLQGAAQDFKGAAEAFRAAADLGEPDAQYAYAGLLKEGRGVERDLARSLEQLAKAAAQDQTAATVEYAIALFNGAGVAKDEAEAARLFRRAADRGNAIAQNRLARLYANGRGVARDPVRAAVWHRMAAAQGLVDPWLEGFAQSLSEPERAAAAALRTRWTAPFGPTPVADVAAAAGLKP